MGRWVCGWTVIALLAACASRGDGTCSVGTDHVVRLSGPAIVFVWPERRPCPGEERGVDCERPSDDLRLALRAQYKRLHTSARRIQGALLACSMPTGGLNFEFAGRGEAARVSLGTSWPGALLVCPGDELRFHMELLDDGDLLRSLDACTKLIAGRRTRR